MTKSHSMRTDRLGAASPAVSVQFSDGAQARTWLVERLERLELSVKDSAELQKMAALLTGDALSQLESDPLTFRRTANVNVRELLAQVTEGAAGRTDREGFNIPALERLVLKTLGVDPSHGRDVMAGLAQGLRERIAGLARHGNDDYESAQADIDQGLFALDQGLNGAVRRWEHAPLGFLERRRRRRRLKKQGLDATATLPELQLMLADAAREHRAAFESAMENAARAGIALGIARSYGEVLEWLVTSIAQLERAAGYAAELMERAEFRRGRLPGAWQQEHVPLDRINAVTLDMLDRALDACAITTEAFLGRMDMRATSLTRGDRDAFEADLRGWIDGQLQRLGEPSLARVIAGFSSDRDITTDLAQLLASGQPLLRFNDDLHRLWPEGLPAQYYVIAEASDGSLGEALSDACVQVGLPAPLLEERSPNVEGTVSIRVVQMAAGLGWLSEAERLMPMVEVHEEVMVEADRNLETKEGLRAALRDTAESESLGALLPDKVLDALRELRGLKKRVDDARPSKKHAATSARAATSEKKAESSDDDATRPEKATAGRSSKGSKAKASKKAAKSSSRKRVTTRTAKGARTKRAVKASSRTMSSSDTEVVRDDPLAEAV